MKASWLKTDWFFATILTLLFFLLSSSQPFQSIELKAYDLGVRYSARDANDNIAIIAIDDESIENIGRWPWSRDVHAQMIDLLQPAKVVSNTVFFLEPQVDRGFDYLNQIGEKINGSSIINTLVGKDLAQLVKQAQYDLNVDQQLSTSIQEANNVVLAMPFMMGAPQGRPDAALPDYISQFAINQSKFGAAAKRDYHAPPAFAILPPIANIAKNAKAIGHLNSIPDIDGVTRVEPLVIHYDNQYLPSLALQTAMQFLNLTADDVVMHFGESVQIGHLNIATDNQLQMNSFFYERDNDDSAFSVDSFFDVYSGKIPAEKYAGKIVLIGMAATGLGDMQTTPIAANVPPIETLAHNISSILNEDFFITPEWASYLAFLLWLLIGAYLIGLLPKLKAKHATMMTVGIAVALVVLHFIFMTKNGWWVPMMSPLALLVAGHLLLSTKRYLMTERSKLQSDADSSDSNKNLALMLQSQGQLDMAFDRFRKCQLDAQLMDALYNLGLDFERKRQFNKAESVFTYMATFDANYKDIDSRISNAKQLSETLVLGGGSTKTTSDLLSKTAMMEKPMLGRYEVQSELGKGAMGTVYLGKDPKIGREVAIKTLALADEFEASELDAVKSRFFREAETAGKLNHPNIVTIYDAGDEHDLAYIAMELLKGEDLNQFIAEDQLLPLNTVVNIMLKVAHALDYAHRQQVIHRDIKPANIMFDQSADSVKVTDFGIARISDSSKTKTGMILGTPNFMSPEQLSGKKLDGRSDLFSLGTTFYQLVTGKLPFEGDSMANLMYNISHEPHQDITEINANLPTEIARIINQLLAKDMEDRYENGAALAADIEQYLHQAS